MTLAREIWVRCVMCDTVWKLTDLPQTISMLVTKSQLAKCEKCGAGHSAHVVVAPPKGEQA